MASLVQTRKHGKTTIFEFKDNSKKVRVAVNVGFSEDQIVNDDNSKSAIEDCILPSVYRRLFDKSALMTLLNSRSKADNENIERIRDSFINNQDDDTKFVTVSGKYFGYMRNVELPFSGAKLYQVDGYFYVKEQ